MATETKATGSPPSVKSDIQAIADALAKGESLDPEITRRVRERAEQARKEVLATHGVQDVGVQLIREVRGDVPER